MAGRAPAGLPIAGAGRLRPQRVQEQLWDALQGTDLLDLYRRASRGSIHSFGMALDLTLTDRHGLNSTWAPALMT
jgi:D-alanyl-D-alanine dipeptidase